MTSFSTSDNDASSFMGIDTLTPSKGFRLDQFITNRTKPTPGNVGICLSGGGSRALCAGMGQLRALKYLSNENGNLLEQTKAISTVSGGSWLAVPFLYLNKEDVSDDDYLNEYVANPNELVPSETSDSGLSIGQILDQLPKGNPGNNINSFFSIPEIAVLAVALWQLNIPKDMLWQTAIASHLLEPYDLYKTRYENGTNYIEEPNTRFSFYKNTLKVITDLKGQNPDFDKIKTHLYAQGTNRLERPFMICNTAMFVKTPKEANGFRFLVPVQCTPFFTGVVGTPSGQDANGKTPGGGGVTSLSFNSTLQKTDSQGNSRQVQITQNRPFSLLDIVGASSAAFAEKIGNLFTKTLKETKREVLRSPKNNIKPHHQTILEKAAEKLNSESHLEMATPQNPESDNFLQDFIPRYDYWPTVDATAKKDIKPTEFADGGSLENTGLASLLSYEDIDKAIAFINTSQPITSNVPPTYNFVPSEGIFWTTVEVDTQLSSLFGFQPYDNGAYKLYKGDSTDKSPEFSHNQIFQSEDFVSCLKNLWQASTKNGKIAAVAPAIYKQNLKLLPNDWFGIKNSRNVTVVWYYLNPASEWTDLLREDVKSLVPNNFPNYSTFSTQLSNTKINLLANYTAWCVASDQFKDIFMELYT